MIFYPHLDELSSSSLPQKIEVLADAAERYKAIILDSEGAGEQPKANTPSLINHAFNWEEIAKLLREIREMPEASPSAKLQKADHLTKLAEIYEVLRAAKMPKLEAVRLALTQEAQQLKH